MWPVVATRSGRRSSACSCSRAPPRALRLREPGAGPPPVTAYPEPPRPAEPPLLQPESAPRPDLPPLSGDPVLWKERCTAWRPAWGLPTVGKVLAAVATGLAVVLFVAGAIVVVKRVNLVLQPEQAEQLANRPGAQDLGGWLLVGAGVFAAGRYLLPLAVGLSGAIAGERFRRTLDALLSTPLDRRAVLRAKVQAAAERGMAFAAVAVAAVGMAFTADGGVRLGAVAGARLGGAAALLVLSGFGLVIGAGAWLSVRCPTDARAFRLLLPVAVLAIGWPVGVWNLLAEDVSPDVLLRDARCGRRDGDSRRWCCGGTPAGRWNGESETRGTEDRSQRTEGRVTEGRGQPDKDFLVFSGFLSSVLCPLTSGF